jgi:NTE family protein
LGAGPGPEKAGDLWPHERLRRKICQSDGGVYDNIGLEAVFDRCEPVFASAAGAPFSKKPMAWKDIHTKTGAALRASNILSEQTRALRRRLLLRRDIIGHIAGCYSNIGSSIAR